MKHLILGQILGIFATILTCISFQCNTKRSVLAVQTLATVCTCFSYLFLGASSGFILNIICIIRNFVFYFQTSATMPSYLTAGIFSVLMAVLGAFSWQGIISLLLIVALMANTVVLSLGKPQALRISILFTSTMVIVYNVFVFSLGGIINESIAIASSVVGILRFYKKAPTIAKNSHDPVYKKQQE